MKLIATRHAETNYNIKDLVNYDPTVNVFLTENGIKQAENLAEQLKDFNFDAIYVSRLKRTKQTANIINQYHNQTLITNELLDDTRNGFEGRPYSEAKGRRDSQPDPTSARYMDKYESVNDMTNRVQQFINYLKQRHRDNETILIVTSSHLIKQLRMLHGEITMQELLNTPAKHATYYEFDI
jgi:probable phosphoglycerate mutase